MTHAAQPDTPARAQRAAALAAAPAFQRIVVVLIILAGLLTGLETYPRIVRSIGGGLATLNGVILVLFCIELIVRMAAYGTKPWRFFADFWNVFDFVIVVLCLLPVGAENAAAARLIRLLRVLRLFTAVPRLKVILAAMAHALPSIGYVGILLALLLYVYGVIGNTLFAANDPVHFGSLHTSMLSLIRVVTLEDWTDLMYIQIYGSDVYGYSDAAQQLSPEQAAAWTPKAMPIAGVLYFVSFVLVGTIIVLNLFVGIVLTSLTDAQAAQARTLLTDRSEHDPVDGRLDRLESLAQDLHADLQALREIIRDRQPPTA
ncbi:MAG: ion transporter [Planctomycetota bacterium]